jgi:hypothetical protein
VNDHGLVEVEFRTMASISEDGLIHLTWLVPNHTKEEQYLKYPSAVVSLEDFFLHGVLICRRELIMSKCLLAKSCQYIEEFLRMGDAPPISS